MDNYKEYFYDLVRSIGSLTYGKERWFHEDSGLWYDRMTGERMNTVSLMKTIIDTLEKDIEGC